MRLTLKESMKQSRHFHSERVQHHVEMMRFLKEQNRNKRIKKQEEDKEQNQIRTMIVKQQHNVTKKKVQEF